MATGVTIAMTRYGESDELLARTLSAAAAQQGMAGEILFVDQRVDAPFDEGLLTEGNLPMRVIVDACGSLSAARNIALKEARFDHILYLDADALPQPDWALRMSAALDLGGVAIVGGRIVPGWEHTPPFFTRANVVLDQYSMLDLGKRDGPATKIVGASFGVDRSKIPSHIKFDPELGRREGRLFGGEESAGASFLRRDGTTWSTDKDGIILDLLAAEITAKTGRDPGEHYQALEARFGSPVYERMDAPASPEQKAVLKNLSPEQVTANELAGEAILAKLTKAPGNGAAIGGLKVCAENGWPKEVEVGLIGSCTNSRIEDLRAAAQVAKGHKKADSVKQVLVVPGSGLVKQQAEKEGLDKIFIEAGFEWRQPGCSMCLAMNPDRLQPGEHCASTSNRNFEGRQGNGGRTHLVSPAMAAAAAIHGHFVDVRKLG